MMSTIKSTMKGRNLYGTESLHFALGSRLRRGDVVCILHGCSNPVALRLTQAGNFLVKGTCFLEGWMDPWSKGKVDWTEDESTQFILV
ncbi:hypothetical protein BKA66DRAFT_467665 [Pyrenochaeta sp. MPI-SDFR-AT-0127]|nr:hypothetical protein BKA66DRAFT_467665 [Pyrenochaeta sp. MPI-SDFR-AT-0127]